MKNTSGETDIRQIRMLIMCVEFAVKDNSLLQVLEQIQQAILESQSSLHKNEAIADQEWRDASCDGEIEHIENLLGISFVICQTYLDSVAQRLINIHEKSLKSNKDSVQKKAQKYQSALNRLPKKKECMFDIGERVPTDYSVTKVEAIHQVANYFKHREAWPNDWNDQSKGNAIRPTTRNAILKLGCKPHSRDNLRTAAKSLGNRNFADVKVFSEICRDWARLILDMFKTELLAREDV